MLGATFGCDPKFFENLPPYSEDALIVGQKDYRKAIKRCGGSKTDPLGSSLTLISKRGTGKYSKPRQGALTDPYEASVRFFR